MATSSKHNLNLKAMINLFLKMCNIFVFPDKNFNKNRPNFRIMKCQRCRVMIRIHKAISAEPEGVLIIKGHIMKAEFSSL